MVLILLGLTLWAGISPPVVQGRPLAAATTVSVQTIITTGISPTLNAASTDGNDFLNDGRTVLNIRNGNIVTLYYTVTTPLTQDGLALDDLSGTISAAQEKFIGPFNKTIYDGAGGKATISWSTPTTITFVVLSQ
jgi:hypothetical protein